MAKTFKVLFLTILFNAVLFIGIPYAYLAYQSSQMEFTIDKWHEHEEKRVEIVDDLLEEYDFTGWSETKVIKLLGEPVKEGGGKEPNNIVYDLGDERGYPSIDREWLIFWFDENYHVTKVEITTD